MHFGIFSNGFRPHTSAANTYEEDIYEIDNLISKCKIYPRSNTTYP